MPRVCALITGGLKEQLQDIATLVRWRLEAAHTRKTYAEIARQRTLVYHVEQVFLFQRATNRLLLQVAAEPAPASDSATTASLLAEIQQFARDYLHPELDARIEEFSIGDRDVWIATGAHAYLAAVIRGNSHAELRAVLQSAIERIETAHGPALADFSADEAAFQAIAPELTRCLKSEYKRMPQLPRVNARFAIVAAAMAVPLLAAFSAVRGEQRWRAFVARLKAEPGILVAATERNWFGPSRIVGLRDARSRDPAALAKQAKLDPAGIHFEWKEYSAAEPPVAKPRLPSGAVVRSALGGTTQRDEIAAPKSMLVLEQFKAAFPLPPNVTAEVTNETLVLAGSAPFEWINAVREGAPKIAGIAAINGDDLVVEFDPELVLQRFRDQFGMPEGIRASLRGGRLLLTGEAPHVWLDRVRRGAMHLPGIHLLDDRKVEDIDQRAFTETKGALEEAAVLFGLSRESVRPDATPVLERVAEDARRCLAAAANLGVNVRLEVHGYGDMIAAQAENAELSRRRAEAVRGVLIASGVDGAKLQAVGLGAPPAPGPGEKSGAGKFDRRVFFRVVIQP